MSIVQTFSRAIAQERTGDNENWKDCQHEARAALRSVKPEDISDGMCVAFNAVLDEQYPYVRLKYDFDTLRRAIAAAIAAGAVSEGERP